MQCERGGAWGRLTYLGAQEAFAAFACRVRARQREGLHSEPLTGRQLWFTPLLRWQVERGTAALLCDRCSRRGPAAATGAASRVELEESVASCRRPWPCCCSVCAHHVALWCSRHASRLLYVPRLAFTLTATCRVIMRGGGATR